MNYIQSVEDVVQSESVTPVVNPGLNIPNVSDLTSDLALEDTEDVDF